MASPLPVPKKSLAYRAPVQSLPLATGAPRTLLLRHWSRQGRAGALVSHGAVPVAAADIPHPGTFSTSDRALRVGAKSCRNVIRIGHSLDSNPLSVVMLLPSGPPSTILLTGVQDPNRHWVRGALCVLLLASGTAGGG